MTIQDIAILLMFDFVKYQIYLFFDKIWRFTIFKK